MVVCFLSSQFPVQEIHSLLSPALLSAPTTSSALDLQIKTYLNAAIAETDVLIQKTSWKVLLQFMIAKRISISQPVISEFVNKCPYPKMVGKLKKFCSPKDTTISQRMRLRILLFRITHGYYSKINPVISALEMFPQFSGIRKIYEKNRNKFQDDMIALLYATGEIDRKLAITYLKNIARRNPTEKNIAIIQKAINTLELFGVQVDSSLLYYAKKSILKNIQIWIGRILLHYSDGSYPTSTQTEAAHNLSIMNDQGSLKHFSFLLKTESSTNSPTPYDDFYENSAKINLNQTLNILYSCLAEIKDTRYKLKYIRTLFKLLDSKRNNINILSKWGYRDIVETILLFISIPVLMQIPPLLYLLVRNSTQTITLFIPWFFISLGFVTQILLYSLHLEDAFELLMIPFSFIKYAYVELTYLFQREKHTEQEKNIRSLIDFYGENIEKIDSAIQELSKSSQLQELIPLFLYNILERKYVNRTTRLLIAIGTSRPLLILNTLQAFKYDDFISYKTFIDILENIGCNNSDINDYLFSLYSVHLSEKKYWKPILQLIIQRAKPGFYYLLKKCYEASPETENIIFLHNKLATINIEKTIPALIKKVSAPNKQFRRSVLKILSQHIKLWENIEGLLDNNQKNPEKNLQLISTHPDNHIAIPFLLTELNESFVSKTKNQMILKILIAIGEQAIPSLHDFITTNYNKLTPLELRQLENKLNDPACYTYDKEWQSIRVGNTEHYGDIYENQEITVETKVSGFDYDERTRAVKRLAESGMKEAFEILQARLNKEESISNEIEQALHILEFKFAIDDAIRTIHDKSLIKDISCSSSKHIHKAA